MSMSMSMSVLMSLLLVSFRYYMAVWMVHMSTSMRHVHVDAACPCWMSMLHVYAARPRCMSMLYVNSACSCWLSMRHGGQTACRYRGNDRNASVYIYIWPVHKLIHIPYRKQGLAVFRVPLPNTLPVFKIIFFYFLRIIIKNFTILGGPEKYETSIVVF
jgi:hypothetical protein